MRLVRVNAKPTFPVCFVFTVISIEILDVGIALEGEDVSRDAIQKPAVVADHDRATREVLKCLFKGTHCIYVEIVCGLVQENDVSSGF